MYIFFEFTLLLANDHFLEADGTSVIVSAVYPRPPHQLSFLHAKAPKDVR